MGLHQTKQSVRVKVGSEELGEEGGAPPEDRSDRPISLGKDVAIPVWVIAIIRVQSVHSPLIDTPRAIRSSHL